jgi:2,4-dienoyl-CoA reductase-like NADH-dependent reductase (Old Yellow Enzyme family)
VVAIRPDTPLLFTPLDLRGRRPANRIVISPMCQYSADDGMPDDWHLAHLGKFATGGAGIVFIEATAVEKRGRITHGDVGLWDDGQIAAHKRVVEFVQAHGALAALQLAHAGRKASMQRPWFGNGPLDDADIARGDTVWEPVGASPLPVDDGWLVPHELSAAEIADVVAHWAAAATRAVAAGYDVLEIHGAHGYLIHSFLSPLANKRTDGAPAACAWPLRSPRRCARSGPTTVRCSTELRQSMGRRTAGASTIRSPWRANSRGAAWT